MGNVQVAVGTQVEAQTKKVGNLGQETVLENPPRGGDLQAETPVLISKNWSPP